MLVSRQWQINRSPDDDWFDAILNTDTKLFIDPFLVFKEKAGAWSGAHQRIIQHFDIAFRLIAEGNMNPESVAYRKALHLLEFPEPKELCLGYTAKGTRGSGGGREYAARIGEAIAEAIRRGLEHPKHFEELGILNEGIGADRISDATATILKRDLIAYTQSVAARHGVATTLHRIYAADFDEDRLRWVSSEVEVPTNPFTGQPFLFVPQRFLDDLPTLNADDWWASYENERLREDVNYEIMGRVDKATIVAIARDHPDKVRAWTERKEQESADPYDLEKDPKGVWQWDVEAEKFTHNYPVALASAADNAQFFDVIEKVVDQFKLFVEQQGGWSLLWNDEGTPKPEEAVQLLFRGVVQHYCHANDIVIDREVELGRGPVDFKFSNGYQHRALLEIKKEHNGKFWNGLEQQLPSYMNSDLVTDGWFIAVQYRSTEAAKRRLAELPERLGAGGKNNMLNLRFASIDAQKPLSASRL